MSMVSILIEGCRKGSRSTARRKRPNADVRLRICILALTNGYPGVPHAAQQTSDAGSQVVFLRADFRSFDPLPPKITSPTAPMKIAMSATLNAYGFSIPQQDMFRKSATAP